MVVHNLEKAVAIVARRMVQPINQTREKVKNDP